MVDQKIRITENKKFSFSFILMRKSKTFLFIYSPHNMNHYLKISKLRFYPFSPALVGLALCFALGYHDVAMLLTGLFLLSLLIISCILTIASKKKRLAHNKIKNKPLRSILHL